MAEGRSLVLLPLGQIRLERIWSNEVCPKGSGQDGPETKGGPKGRMRERPHGSRVPFAGHGAVRSLRQGGFSLLEVLVAFSILALCLGILLRIFGGGGRLAGLADEHVRAMSLAESLLASAGVETPLQPGESDGKIDDQFRWTLRVTPYIPAGEPLPEQLPFKPYWVELSVQWGNQELRSFTLGTLRLLAKKQQSVFEE